MQMWRATVTCCYLHYFDLLLINTRMDWWNLSTTCMKISFELKLLYLVSTYIRIAGQLCTLHRKNVSKWIVARTRGAHNRWIKLIWLNNLIWKIDLHRTDIARVHRAHMGMWKRQWAYSCCMHRIFSIGLRCVRCPWIGHRVTAP